MIDPNALKLLACPVSGGPLTYNPLTQRLDSEQGQVSFPIVNGIPDLLPESAEPLTQSGGANS